MATRLGSERAEVAAREGRARTRLAPGDVIALQSSDVVPADARLLAAWDLEVDESTLTGESVPVDKDVEATPGAPVPERTCMAFEGTTVLAGSGFAVVVATGESTQAGRASRAAGRAAPATSVQARLAEITHMALPATALGGAGVAGLGLLRNVPLREAIAAGVSVAVAAVPEGLPLVATVAQAGAARRLSRRGVLVRSSRTSGGAGARRHRLLRQDRHPDHRPTGAHSGGEPPRRPGPRRSGRPANPRRGCPCLPGRRAGGDRQRLARHRPGRAGGGERRRQGHRRGHLAAGAGVLLRGQPRVLRVARLDNGTVELAVKGAPEVVLPLCASAVNGDGAKPRALDDAGRSAARRRPSARGLAPSPLTALAHSGSTASGAPLTASSTVASPRARRGAPAAGLEEGLRHQLYLSRRCPCRRRSPPPARPGGRVRDVPISSGSTAGQARAATARIRRAAGSSRSRRRGGSPPE